MTKDKHIETFDKICEDNFDDKPTIKQRRKFALIEGKDLKQKEIFGK